jgi:hypothetical protein
MMNVDEKVEYWLDIASYDLKTAQSMKKREEPEYTHNLIRLCEISGLNKILSENQKQFVDTLRSFTNGS